jgi:cephalosporin hydroxylase
MIKEKFLERDKVLIADMARNETLKKTSALWLSEASKYEYAYHFSWLGLPIIQLPQDIVAMQEIMWQVKPDLVIETGVAYGGSLIFYASMMEMLGGDGQVVGIDVDLKNENRSAIQNHPLYKRITIIDGSSIDSTVAQRVCELAQGKKSILVVLDSNHTYKHVLAELELYSKLVTKDSYLVVFDTVIEDMPDTFSPYKKWSENNNPKAAVRDFLKQNDRFVIDKFTEDKLLITASPDGYLKCIKS